MWAWVRTFMKSLHIVIANLQIKQGERLLANTDKRWVLMDHSKSKKHEGVAVYLATSSNLSKKLRIVVFEHLTHQLVIVLIDELVTVCMRS